MFDMGFIADLLSLRTILVFVCSTFSILLLMLVFNIITVDDMATILKLSADQTAAVKLVIGRLQEVVGHFTDILSQLLNKIFGWAGVDIDLSKINIDANQHDNPPAGNQGDPGVNSGNNATNPSSSPNHGRGGR